MGNKVNVLIYPCHGVGDAQLWHYSTNREFRKDGSCLEYNGGTIGLYDCQGVVDFQVCLACSPLLGSKFLRSSSGLGLQRRHKADLQRKI